MPDTGVTEDQALSITLDASDEITREAIANLVASTLPAAIAIDGRDVALEATVTGTRSRVTLRWARGSLRLRIGLTTAANERKNEADRGHRQSLQAWSEDGSREVAWNGLEWFVRDAIREGRSTVPVVSRAFPPPACHAPS